MKANSKIVKERIWINPVTNKIVIQPLEPYTDAQSHGGACDYSEKRPLKSARRVPQEKMSQMK